MTSKPYSNKHPAGVKKDSQPGKIKNRRSALKWLRENGFQCGKGTIYRHVRQGKLPMSPAGTIDLEDLRLYAAGFLQPAERPPDHRGVIAACEQERAVRIELLRVRAEKLKFEHNLTKDQYLLRDDVHLAWSIRLGFLETHLKGLFRTNAESWLMACGADPAAGGILFGLMEKELDELLGYLGDLEELKVVVKKRPINEN